MSLPTFVARFSSVFNTYNTPKTKSVTVQDGDLLVISAMVGDGDTLFDILPIGGGLVYTLIQASVNSQYCNLSVWTATATSNATFTVEMDRSGNPANHWGFSVFVFRGSAGVGLSQKTIGSGAPSLTFTTGYSNSIILTLSADWNFVVGTSRVWRKLSGISPSEKRYSWENNMMTNYEALYLDSGVAGSKIVGLSAPAGQKYSITAVEIRGELDSLPLFVGWGIPL